VGGGSGPSSAQENVRRKRMNVRSKAKKAKYALKPTDITISQPAEKKAIEGEVWGRVLKSQNVKKTARTKFLHGEKPGTIHSGDHQKRKGQSKSTIMTGKGEGKESSPLREFTF